MMLLGAGAGAGAGRPPPVPLVVVLVVLVLLAAVAVPVAQARHHNDRHPNTITINHERGTHHHDNVKLGQNELEQVMARVKRLAGWHGMYAHRQTQQHHRAAAHKSHSLLEEENLPGEHLNCAEHMALIEAHEAYLLLGRGGGASVYLTETKEHKGELVGMKILNGKDEWKIETRVVMDFGGEGSCKHVMRTLKLCPKENAIMTGYGGADLLVLKADPDNARPTKADMKSRDMSSCEVTAVLVQVLRGLSCLKGQGYVHQDIKLDNIFAHPETGVVTVGDLGYLSRVHAIRGYTGSAPYMAPEIINEQGDNGKIDVWSTGMVGAILMTGDMPYAFKIGATSSEIIKARKARAANAQLSELNNWGKYAKNEFKKFDAGLKSVVLDMLHDDPKQRLDLATALRKLEALDCPSDYEATIKGWIDKRKAHVSIDDPLQELRRIQREKEDHTTAPKRKRGEEKNTWDKIGSWFKKVFD